MILEICVETVESALNACRGGAKRLELCSALCLGGLTPTVGLFRKIKKLIPEDCSVFVMIRPKAEDYVYSDHEIEVMAEDISVFIENGADGFVFGCLKESKTIDREACKKLLETAKGLPCTFHRAFDVVSNPEECLEDLISLGFSRVLTSGQEKTAFLGRQTIKKLIKIVNDRGSSLIVMPGGGIDPSNLKDILETTEANEFHGSARARNNRCEETVWVTDESVVRQMVQLAKRT